MIKGVILGKVCKKERGMTHSLRALSHQRMSVFMSVMTLNIVAKATPANIIVV